ncbi:MAG: hypothetical protein EA425_07120 [Puniceicoccaceae bacterium]|nr:MAG: hypothetical protein EA425_07120 [Puniceicoccaceae bacterium]
MQALSPLAFFRSLTLSAAFSALVLTPGLGEETGPTPRNEDRPTLMIERAPRASVIVYSQVTPAGRDRLPPPTAENPQTYILANHGMQQLGPSRRSGSPPDPEMIESLVRQGLALSHYVPATDESERLDLAIVCFAGVINRDVVTMGNTGFTLAGDSRMVDFGSAPDGAGVDPAAAMGAAMADQAAMTSMINSQEFVRNFDDLLAMVGGDALDRMSRFDPGRERLMAEANSDRYFIILMAYDGEDVVQGDKPTLLWISRMSVSTLGTSLVDALPAMVVAGHEHFGRPTLLPEATSFRRRGARVTIGDLEYQGVVNPREVSEER